MHIYAFGSICRGEVSRGSDIDLLAIVEGQDSRFSPAAFSIYSYARLRALWREGNPFAWHLRLESRLLFASDDADFLANLGSPARYSHGAEDCAKFRQLFEDASQAFPQSRTQVFELATMFLAIRNLATCYALAKGTATFSRDAARQLGADSLAVDAHAYAVLENARLLSSRGIGTLPSDADFRAVLSAMSPITQWVEQLANKVKLL